MVDKSVRLCYCFVKSLKQIFSKNKTKIMKKIALLFTVLICTHNITEAQTKSGILKKDYYNFFSGDDWEDFLAGRRADDFEKKSNVKLDDYLKNQVTPFVKGELKEASIASAVANSTVVDFPKDADVYTTTTDGTWITRKAYPGEKGFFHTATGIYWLSFSCGNLTAFRSGPAPVKKADIAYVEPKTEKTESSGPNNNNNNILLSSQGVDWNTGYGIYSMGRNDRTAAFSEDALMFMAIQKSATSNCNTCPSNSSTATVTYAQPAMYYAAPATQVATAPASSNQNVTVRNKANGLDIANTLLYGANTFFNGVNTFRGYRIEGNRNPTVRYGNGWTGSSNPTVRYGNGFQPSDQLGATFSGVGQFGSSGNQFGGTGSWGNTWN